MTFPYRDKPQPPHLLGEPLQITPNDRAAIMGAQRDKDDLGKDTIIVRFVMTGYVRTGMPLVACERMTGKDALGVAVWTAYNPPTQIITSALTRILWPFLTNPNLNKPCEACGSVHAGMC